MRAACAFFLLVPLMMMTACGHLSKKTAGDSFQLKTDETSPAEQAETGRIIRMLEGKNAGLTSCKGVGKIRIYDNEQYLNARLAWTTDAFGRIRLAFLGIDGRPTMSLAADHKKLYAYSHPEDRLYKKKRSKDSLTPFLSMDLPIDAVWAFLRGQIPLPAHESARIAKDENSGGVILTLKTEGTGDMEKIFMGPEQNQVSGMAYYRDNGELSYRAAIGGYQQVGAYEFFKILSVTNGKAAGLLLEIDRCIPDMPVDPSIFKLSDRDH